MARLALTLLWAAGLLVVFPNSTFAEYFKSGYPACDSREHLDQFLAIAKGGDKAKIFEYTLERQWCIYPRDLEVRLITLTSDGRAFVAFEGTNVNLWSLTKAIGIHPQPPARNVLIEDPQNPDGPSVCHMISLTTRVPGGGTDAMLRSLMSFTPSSSTSQLKKYEQAIRDDEYDLVTDWTEGSCVTALYVLREKPVACVVDYRKYYRCRRGKTDDTDVCYRDLCTARTSPSR